MDSGINRLAACTIGMRYPKTPPRRPLLAILAAGAFLFALPPAPVGAENPLNAEAVAARQIPGRMGSLSCASATCHGRLEPRAAVSGMARQEFIHWTTADPHARAGARILEKPFQDVLNRLVNQYSPSHPTAEQKANIRATVYEKCAACHDEAGVAEHKRRKDAGEKLKLDDFENPKLAHGIDCESCHGGSERWLAVHYQAWVPKALLLEMGMVDTDDLVGRAQQCTSCHVGGPGKDMNHDMIAAGHPPLRFELSAYHAVIQRKHWDERKVRQLNPDYDIHLWQAGQWATAQATAELLAERAKKAQAERDPKKLALDCKEWGEERAAKEKAETNPGKTLPAPWPEFAEYNCFSCHQQLREGARELWTKSTTKPEDKRYLVGLPAWGGWNTLPLELFVDSYSTKLPPPAGERSFTKLLLAMENFSKVDDSSLMAAKKAACSVSEELTSSALNNPKLSLADLLVATPELETAGKNPSWELISHRYLLLASAFRSHRDQLQSQSISTAPPGAVAGPVLLDSSLTALKDRLTSAATSLGFTGKDAEWPAVYAAASQAGSSPPPGNAVKQSAREVAENLNAILEALKVAADRKD